MHCLRKYVAEDEALLLDYINAAPENVKFIIAPHKIESEKIENFIKKINKKTFLHSHKDEVNISEYEVLIIDCIGLLSKLYSYADIAYVGGAAGKTGLHNILEPATFGVPIIIGKNFSEFPEAIRLQDLAGLYAIQSPQECSRVIDKFVIDANFRSKTGMICGHYVNTNSGATKTIINWISDKY